MSTPLPPSGEPVESLENSIVGSLWGTAVGDAMGLGYEGLTLKRQHKLFPEITGPHFLWGRGMCSDDTEHASMVAQALISTGGEGDLFTRKLAKKLRWWLVGMPAGVGFATLRSILKLWVGFSPQSSGVFSAGNGPAMRSPLLGVCFGHEKEKLVDLVSRSTDLTHRDPKARIGALAAAVAAHLSRQGQHDPDYFCATLAEYLEPNEENQEFYHLVALARQSALDWETAASFSQRLGLEKGVSGYMYHTIPVVLQVWFRRGTDYKSAILEIIRCGGDTDTTAAILGGIVGAYVGREGIPQPWKNRVIEWPRSINWLDKLGQRLTQVVHSGQSQTEQKLFWPALPLRNILFASIVLSHGFKRMLPPY